ncbi:NADH-quinone oxidoreductase subunit NuoG [Thiofilum flexile]|uniref:NADH-quinone oxidoreductase subunit NuoG n=1 Tax=Thiofilum flexile TaxID=125627 RepID=UPI0003792041|nr:NADH-quinone oxidoreductase subunit NuoG [Thiofilum flexile]
MSELITIEVNGKAYDVRPGQMLIEATDNLGIEVPRFCYHKHLSIAANCRMCLVEVEKMGKPLPACATPVAAGMKVWTQSEKAVDAQQAMMEFLLINHPLDCPICDQGGECELQDQAMTYGKVQSRYQEVKRVVLDPDIGPLIETEMTRCIQCTRCVRFGTEIAGIRELGGIGRGDRMAITTYVEQALQSELSGNIIDVCPVGALTAKPSRYTARAWEMIAHATVAAHDSVGSNIEVHTFDNKIVRVVPRENDTINQCWISDRDRFSYEGLNSSERVLKPLIKRDGEWQTVSWQEALAHTHELLTQLKPEQSTGLASANATLEELYLFQKVLQGLGVSQIEHRLRQVDAQATQVLPAVTWLGLPIEQISEQKLIILIGSDVRHEQPMLNHRIHLAQRLGAQVFALNMRQVAFNYPVEQLAVAPAQLSSLLQSVISGLSEQGLALPNDGSTLELIQRHDTQNWVQGLLAALAQAQGKVLVLLGNSAQEHPYYADLATLAQLLAQQLSGHLGFIPPQANSVGADWVTTLAPQDEVGKAVELNSELDTVVLLNVEPEYDTANPYLTLSRLRQAKQVIAITSFMSPALRDYATVILPCTPWAETSGTYVNAEGTWQFARAVTEPKGEARPAWKILRVIGHQLSVPECEYVNIEQISFELRRLVDKHPLTPPTIQPVTTLRISNESGLERIGEVQAYRVDNVVRRASALQALVPETKAHIHPNTATHLALMPDTLVTVRQGEASLSLPVWWDESLPENTVWIAGGTEASAQLGEAWGRIELRAGGKT